MHRERYRQGETVIQRERDRKTATEKDRHHQVLPWNALDALEFSLQF